MKAYPDTTFLCALYRSQDNSDRALDYRANMDGPLPVSRLLLWEFRQSVRFQAFRYRQNRAAGYPLREAEKMLADLAEDMQAGLVIHMEYDVTTILARGEQLSKLRTPTGGHRGFDLLHVATALELGASDFLTFDANQTALARAEGLATPLAS